MVDMVEVDNWLQDMALDQDKLLMVFLKVDSLMVKEKEIMEREIDIWDIQSKYFFND